MNSKSQQMFIFGTDGDITHRAHHPTGSVSLMLLFYQLEREKKYYLLKKREILQCIEICICGFQFAA